MAAAKTPVNGPDAADWWLKEIAKSRTDWKDYRDDAYEVLERYRDERDQSSNAVRFNILYSNTETLKPAVYSQSPKPDVRRRFLDKDPVGKMGSEVLQRCLAYAMDCHDFDGVLEGVRDDYILPGFAVARVRYKPYFEKDKAGKETGLAYEEVLTEYVGWDSFAMSRSKTWDKVWWVAFAEDLTKEEATAIFGAKAEKLAYTYRAEDDKDKRESEDNKARVWEVWNKRTRMCLYVSEGQEEFLMKNPDPLKLEQFFPCPKPLWMLSTTGKLVPIPEYMMYRDLAEELDDITERIHVLVSAIRRRGVYDAHNKAALEKIANTARDNHFEPIEDWTTFTAKGGLKASLEEMDLQILAQTVLALYDYRDRCLNIIYQVTGMADIIRGSSQPNETATAQAIKGKYAGMRIGNKQKAFAKFSRDMLRIMGEVIAERFSPQMLAMQSGVQLPTAQQKQQFQMQQQAQQKQAQMAQPPQVDPAQAKFFAQPAWEDVVKLLRNDKLRGFKIDIETDSTVLQDQEAERQSRVELLQALGGFMQQMVPGIQTAQINPATAKEVIAFTLRGFKSSQAIEDALEEAPAGMPPQVAQAQQQIQRQQEQLAQQQAKAKDDTHEAQLAGKDADMKRQDARHAEDLLKLKSDFEERMKSMHAEHHSQVEQLMGEAERTAVDAIKKATPPPQATAPTGVPA
jgi:hypothetical protein